MRRLLSVLLLITLLALGALPALAQDANIVDTAAAAGDFNTLLAAATAAGLADTLATGEFTVFAPTDGAFNTLLTNLGTTADALLADTALLTSVLTYHVVPGTLTFDDLAALSAERNDGVVYLVTVNGNTLKLNVDAATGAVVIDDGAASIVTADVLASNGVIHVIDNVLLPIEGDPNAQAAPDATPAPAARTYPLTTLNGAPLTISLDEDGELVLAGDVRVIEADTRIGRSIVHVIDGVLLPPPAPVEDEAEATEEATAQATAEATAEPTAEATEAMMMEDGEILTALRADERFSTLVAAIDAAGVGSALEERAYTIFAPTNEAFEAALDALDLTAEDLLADTELLTDVLTYHVVFFRYNASQLYRLLGATPPMMDDMSATGTPAAPAAVNTQGTIVGVAAGAGNFGTLVAAVEAAGLTSTLATGQFTVFAPTDGAFNTLLTNLGTTPEALLADTALLNSVLTYHVVPGRLTFADLAALSAERNDGVVVLTTVNGAELQLNVDVDAGTVIFNNGAASLVSGDIAASNGVIHVIDNVLLPPA